MSLRRFKFSAVSPREKELPTASLPSPNRDCAVPPSLSAAPADKAHACKLISPSLCTLKHQEEKLPPLTPPLSCVPKIPMRLSIGDPSSSSRVLPAIAALDSKGATSPSTRLVVEDEVKENQSIFTARWGKETWRKTSEIEKGVSIHSSDMELNSDIHSHKKIIKRRRVLEWEDDQGTLFRCERAQRSVILGLEHESRYRLLWEYHEATEKYRVTEGTRRRRELAWKEERYMQSVHAYQRWSRVWTEEVNAREELLGEEQQRWEYLCGCWDVECLQLDAAASALERTKAEERWEEHETVRQSEIKAGKKRLDNEILRGKRLSNTSPLPTQDGHSVPIMSTASAIEKMHAFFSFDVSNKEKGKNTSFLSSRIHRRLQSLASPELLDEEFYARQWIRQEEGVHRIIWMSEGEKMIHIAQEEWKERQDLHKLFYAGWSSYHLSCMISIQRWWRQVRAHPWSYYRRQHYRSVFAARRSMQTSGDYKRKIARLEKQFIPLRETTQMTSSLVSSPLPKREDKTDEMVQQRAHQRDRLAFLSAASFRYKFMIDLYTFSLQRIYEWFMEDQRRHFMILIDLCLQRFPDVQDRRLVVARESNDEWMVRRRLEKQLEAIFSAPHSMPRRLFTRYRLPYASWRATRWLRFSESSLQLIQALITKEKIARNDVLSCCERNLRSIRVVHCALLSGLQAAQTCEINMSMLHKKEREHRHLLEQEEKDERVEAKVSQLRLNDLWQVVKQSRVRLMQEAELVRKTLIEEEALGYEYLVEQAWRWKRLAAARLRVGSLHHCLGKKGWDAEVHGHAARHFVSLDSVVEVIARFYFHTRERYTTRNQNFARDDLLTPAARRTLIGSGCSLVDKVVQDWQCGLDAQLRERRREIRAQKKLNGSKGFLLSSRNTLAGFSFLVVGDPGSLACEPESPSCPLEKITNMNSGTLVKDIDEKQKKMMENKEKIAKQQGVASLVPPAATSQKLWIRHFLYWLEISSNAPREREYKEVLRRFQNQNEIFYNSFAMLLSLMREGRQEIEIYEYNERHRFRNHLSYRICISYQLSILEQVKRRKVIDEEISQRNEQCLEDACFIHKMLHWERAAESEIRTSRSTLKLSRQLFLQSRSCRHVHSSKQVERGKGDHILVDCTTYRSGIHLSENIERYVHNGPSLESILKGQLFPVSQKARHEKCEEDGDREQLKVITKGAKKCILPCLTDLDRLISREEISRRRIELTRKYDVVNLFLLPFSLPFRKKIEEETEETLDFWGRVVDRNFPSHPPVALCSLIAGEERAERERLEKNIWIELYEQPLLFAHRQYLEDCVLMQFMLGHASMSSTVRYMEKNLSDLLIQRAHHVDSKISDLMVLEQASRTRLEYMSNITRTLQSKWKKLVY